MSPILDSIGSVKGYGWGAFAKNISTFLGVMSNSTVDQVVGYSTLLDEDGNYYFAGACESPRSGLLVKVDTSTNPTSPSIAWQKKLATTGSEYFYKVSIDSSKNLYVGSYTNGGTGGGGDDLLIAKYNSSGTLLWQGRYGTTGDQSTQTGPTLDTNGNLIMPYYDAGGAARYVRVSSSGTLTSVHNFSGSDYYIYECALDSSNNIYFGGYGKPGTYYQGKIVKLDSSNSIQWQKTLQSASADVFIWSISLDASGNLYCVGRTGSSCYIAKLDSSGAISWQRTLSSAFGQGNFWDVATDTAGNVYACGSVPDTASPNDYSRGLIVKYNSSGTLQWQRKFTYSNRSIQTNGISVDKYNGVSFTGDLIDYNIFGRIPQDGSKTGTYTFGSFTVVYTTSSYTDAAASLTSSNLSYSMSSGSLTTYTASLTDSSPGFTNTLTAI